MKQNKVGDSERRIKGLVAQWISAPSYELGGYRFESYLNHKWKNEPSWTNGSCLENSRSLKTAWGFETLFFREFGDSKL